MMKTFAETLLTTVVAISLVGCGDERGATSNLESAGKDVTARQALDDLHEILVVNEEVIVKALHRNARLMREDIQISPTGEASWDGASRRWMTSTQYGFIGIAEASYDEFGDNAKIDVTNTEDEPNWTESLAISEN